MPGKSSSIHATQVEPVSAGRTASKLYAAGAVRMLGTGLFCLFLALSAYALAWAVWYRQPPEAPKLVDVRSSKADRACYIYFCAGLASNPHGFPGHCFVVWSNHPVVDFSAADAQGFVPFYSKDQIPSLCTSVPGCLSGICTDGNKRNLDVLTVVVAPKEYERSMRLRQSWSAAGFQCGVRDCVAFTDTIARSVLPRTPRHEYKFPQDYLRELKRLN